VGPSWNEITGIKGESPKLNEPLYFFILEIQKAADRDTCQTEAKVVATENLCGSHHVEQSAHRRGNKAWFHFNRHF